MRRGDQAERGPRKMVTKRRTGRLRNLKERKKDLSRESERERVREGGTCVYIKP